MNKKITALMGALLSLALIFSFASPVLAEENENKTLVIESVDDFLAFAENARLDRYSRDLTVQLQADIDLVGAPFTGVPIFCGTFEGNSHTVTGLSLTQSGSTLGLFRYLTDTAVVKDLTVEGTVSPQGTSASIGLLAGSNAGSIENCTVSGDVSGKDRVGGLVGSNLASGIIEGSHASGSVIGNHFVGGLVGDNAGIIRNSTNSAVINVTSQQNHVEFSDISIDTMTGSESANTVTDIGGIAGTSTGVIHGCINKANVGYPHMGYNIGGIAGSQSGYISDCENTGEISGRKDVGGIVGQLEPVTSIDFSKDTLQILQEQINTMSALTSQASANAHNNTAAMNSQFSQLNGQIESAKDAIDALTPDLPHFDPNDPVPPDFDPDIPDKDSLIAAQNQLSSSMNAMMGTLDSIVSSTQDAAQTLSGDIQAIADHASTMGNTIHNASDHVGGQIYDVSDSDTSDDPTGKVENTRNHGSVLADLNAGGIAGSVAIENDLDHEDDLQFNGYRSLNFQSQIRAVILNCENTAPVSAKKRNAGGIAGKQSVGLVADSLNTGTLDAEKADFIGGISGNSTGFIRRSSAKCAIHGATSVGGIAGSATIVSDSRSLVQISSEDEKLGAILGWAEAPRDEVESPIENNFYLSVAGDVGGIDGISYADVAQPLDMERFLNLEDLPEVFSTVTLTFRFEDGSERSVSAPIGESIDPAQIPAVPEKEGSIGRWDGLDQQDLSSVMFNRTFPIVYSPVKTTVQSPQLREDGRPVLLAVGEFLSGDAIEMEPMSDEQMQSAGSGYAEGYTLKVQPGSQTVQLHYAPPAGYAPEQLRVMVRGTDGSFRKVSSTVEGSYLLFPFTAEDDGFCVITVPTVPKWVIPTAAGIGLSAAGLIGFVLIKKRRRLKAADKAAV